MRFGISKTYIKNYNSVHTLHQKTNNNNNTKLKNKKSAVIFTINRENCTLALTLAQPMLRGFVFSSVFIAIKLRAPSRRCRHVTAGSLPYNCKSRIPFPPISRAPPTPANTRPIFFRGFFCNVYINYYLILFRSSTIFRIRSNAPGTTHLRQTPSFLYVLYNICIIYAIKKMSILIPKYSMLFIANNTLG